MLKSFLALVVLSVPSLGFATTTYGWKMGVPSAPQSSSASCALFDRMQREGIKVVIIHHTLQPVAREMAASTCKSTQNLPGDPQENARKYLSQRYYDETPERQRVIKALLPLLNDASAATSDQTQAATDSAS